MGGKFEVVSRESFLLSNNVLLTVAAAQCLLGTLYPLIVDALGGAKLSVGPPYFNLVFVPLDGAGDVLDGCWTDRALEESESSGSRYETALGVCDQRAERDRAAVCFWRWKCACEFRIDARVLDRHDDSSLNLWERVRVTSGQLTTFQKLRTQSRSYYGMQVAHLGVAVFIVGVTLVTGYQTEQDVRMERGDVVTAGRYSISGLTASRM